MLVFFHKQLKYTLDAFDRIQKVTDRKAADTARSLIRALADPTFIVALPCAKKVMAVRMVLSRSLQKVIQDLYHAIQSVNYIQSTLKKWRGGECEEDMDEWNGGPYDAYFAAHELAEYIGIPSTVPRCASRQTARKNVPSDSPSTSYTRCVVPLPGCYRDVLQRYVFKASANSLVSCSACPVYYRQVCVALLYIQFGT